MEEKETEELTSYKIMYLCENCGRSCLLIFPKGTPAPSNVFTPCPNCGCEALKKYIF